MLSPKSTSTKLRCYLTACSIRRSDIVKEDGVTATSFHRHIVVSSDSVAAEPEVVQLIAGALHDAATVSAYQATQEVDPWPSSASPIPAPGVRGGRHPVDLE